MSDLYEISQNTSPLKTCPVLLYSLDDNEDFEECGCNLQVMTTRTIIRDDYGSWPEVGVYFDCGHTLSQMEEALKYAEYI